MPKILVGGDVSPGRRMLSYFAGGDAQTLFNDLLADFEAADFAIVNLECPLVVEESAIEKTGPVLGAPVSCIQAIKNAHVDAVNLANNHILDHGAAGLETTLEACEKAGLGTVGAGENLDAASRMLVHNVSGTRVGFVAMAEHEFSIAGRNSWGANPLDLAQFIRTVRRHRGQYDFLVVLLHGGIEHYPYPSPRLMETCRFMVEEGAKAVICQHSHCPGCYEEYRGGYIVYGQGNLLFDAYPLRNAAWHEGALVSLTLEEDGACSMEFVPYVQCDRRVGARRMDPDQEDSFRRTFQERSEKIKDPQFVQRQWEAFCKTRENAYLSMLRGHGRFFKRLNARLGWLRHLYSWEKRRLLLNVVRCESHREVIETVCRESRNAGSPPTLSDADA
ncbi:MAG TPA: CapA family protein [Phycisphaerae bacterium]|nr:CapA family protein [Phycisphaerae bacterium]